MEEQERPKPRRKPSAKKPPAPIATAPRCANCVFFSPSYIRGLNNSSCHRHPVHIPTDEDRWCGEHKPQK